MSSNEFDDLFYCLKTLLNNKVSLPNDGEQSKENLVATDNDKSKFTLVMNRKGNYDKDKATYIMMSNYYGGALVRLDIAGPDHYNHTTGENIPTPHLHIMNEEHLYGKHAVALEDVTNFEFASDIINSLISFLEYNNVDLVGVQLPFI